MMQGGTSMLLLQPGSHPTQHVRGGDFAFVVSDDPRRPSNTALRTLIHQRAMVNVAAQRKDRRKHRKAVLKDDDDTLKHSKREQVTSRPDIKSLLNHDVHDRVEGLQKYSAQIYTLKIIPTPQSSYSELCARYGFDLQDLSGLVSYGSSLSVISMFGRSDALGSLLGHRQYTYLAFVPSRYGENPVITAVVDCLMARVHSRLTSNDGLEAMKLYTKALQRVQNSIASHGKTPETLCAVHMLGLYEMLDPTRLEALRHHMAGTVQLIKDRGPSQFESEFEQSLLYAHILPAGLTSIYNKTRCYLEAPEWQELCLSLVSDSMWLTPRSSVVIRVQLANTETTGFLMDIKEAFTNGTAFNSEGDILRRRLERHRNGLLACMDDLEKHLAKTNDLKVPQTELDIRRRVTGNILEHICVSTRLLAAVSDDRRQQLELKVQEAVQRLEVLFKHTEPRHLWYYEKHEPHVIASIRETQTQWLEDVSLLDESERRKRQVARFQNYLDWLRTMIPAS